MRIAFIVFNIDGMGGTSRSAITQANALAPDQDVRIVSVTRSADAPHYDIDDRIGVEYLVDLRDPEHPRAVAEGLADAAEALTLHQRESALVPNRWDKQFTALCDVAMEAALPGLDVDVAVTVTPGLLVAGIDLLPDHVVVVHQEHRSSSGRTSGLEPLLNYAPRADVVALLTPPLEEWLHEQLGALCPPTVVMPNPLPLGVHPRSRLDSPLIVTAGRLVPEKQFELLVAAFAEIADQIPDWRLRICGTGPEQRRLLRAIRKRGLQDRVELPGAVTDMAAEWATASVAALTSRTEGFPLVVQEAMAAGVPVASFDCASGPREIIEHEVNGLLVGPQSAAGMSAALLRLATDVELRATLGEGALRTAQQYDAIAIAERWTSIFSEARGRRGDRGRLASAGRVGASDEGASAVSRLIEVPRDVTPAMARHEALTYVVTAATATGADWLVIPPHETDTTIVVLRMSARDAFLAALADGDPPPYLSLRDPALDGWPERRGTIERLGTDLRRGMTSTICLEPWPEGVLGRGCTIEVQFWELSVGGELVGPRRNPYADRMPVAPATVEVEVEGVTVPTLPLMAAPTVGECRFPVDVVCTWVDGNQLRYSLRSVHLFAPWVRRIHLVSADQVPEWLDADHPMLTSHPSETSLHRSEELAEHFVHFDDGVFLGRPVRPERFFSPSGSMATFNSNRPIGLADVPGRRLPQEASGAVITHYLAPAPRAHRKSILGGPHAGLLTGQAHAAEPSLTSVNLGTADVKRQLSHALDRDQDFIYLADHDDRALSNDRLAGLLADFYDNYFPVAAPWERP